jgi:hypothetical protein
MCILGIPVSHHACEVTPRAKKEPCQMIKLAGLQLRS